MPTVTTKDCEKKLVVNISSDILTDSETHVLCKGLSFSPGSNIDWFQLELDLNNFFCNLKLKIYVW